MPHINPVPPCTRVLRPRSDRLFQVRRREYSFRRGSGKRQFLGIPMLASGGCEPPGTSEHREVHTPCSPTERLLRKVEVPDDHLVTTAAGRGGHPVRCDGETLHTADTPVEDIARTAGRNIPDTHRLVGPRREERAAVRRKGEMADRL